MVNPAYRLHNTERASADRGPYLLPNGTPHDFSFEYTPPKGDKPGSLTARLDSEIVSLSFPADHLKIGAHFNRLGLISTHTDGNGQHLYFDDLTFTDSQAE